ncbi:MAG: PDZ domain-containing protein [Holosporaceae bacterium]|nr:MAG: PDZ domain-containing protein [Holosporaceae bacterium]
MAIPANIAKKVVQNIIDFGRVKRAWLGISVQGITKEIADNLNLKKMEGALVISATDNGPAKQAGIKSRDVILRINDIPIKDTTDVSRTIGQLAVGEVINIDAWRDGTHKQFKAKLQEFQSQEDYRTTIKTSKNVLKDHIKLENYDMGITPLTWQFRQRYNAENPTIQGVLVSDVKEGGWAEKNGILTGDIVLEINGQPITSTETLKEKMDQEARSKKPLLLFLYRMGQKLYVGLRPKPEATVNRK